MYDLIDESVTFVHKKCPEDQSVVARSFVYIINHPTLYSVLDHLLAVNKTERMACRCGTSSVWTEQKKREEWPTIFPFCHHTTPAEQQLIERLVAKYAPPPLLQQPQQETTSQHAHSRYMDHSIVWPNDLSSSPFPSRRHSSSSGGGGGDSTASSRMASIYSSSSSSSTSSYSSLASSASCASTSLKMDETTEE